MPDRDYHEVVGVVHIHSSYSDGSKTIEEIAQIGESAGLDFLMFTDHNTLKPLHDGHQRYHGKIAVLIGYEIEDPNNENHYLAFGLPDTVRTGADAAEYVAEVRRAEGLGIIAHPDEIRNAFPQYPSYPWNAWGLEEYDGLEIWNHMSAWMESLKPINMLKMAIMPRRSLRGPTARVRRKWDEIARSRPIAGIGSADVHAHLYRKGPLRLTIFPYKVQFRSIRTHLLLNEPLSPDIEKARSQIFDAIRACRVFVSNYRWGDARGFEFYAKSRGRIHRIGDNPVFSPGMTLNLSSPKRARVTLIKDGYTHFVDTCSSFEIPVPEDGVYRMELSINGRGWIYSNHIRILAQKDKGETQPG
jgi:hypothetical protein